MSLTDAWHRCGSEKGQAQIDRDVLDAAVDRSISVRGPERSGEAWTRSASRDAALIALKSEHAYEAACQRKYERMRAKDGEESEAAHAVKTTLSVQEEARKQA